jgi:hypothetical protein
MSLSYDKTLIIILLYLIHFPSPEENIYYIVNNYSGEGRPVGKGKAPLRQKS